MTAEPINNSSQGAIVNHDPFVNHNRSLAKRLYILHIVACQNHRDALFTLIVPKKLLYSTLADNIKPTTYRVYLNDEDTARMKTCTTQLTKIAPQDARTFAFRWALALRERDWESGAAIIASANWTGASTLGNNGVVYDNDEQAFSGVKTKVLSCAGLPTPCPALPNTTRAGVLP